MMPPSNHLEDGQYASMQTKADDTDMMTNEENKTADEDDIASIQQGLRSFVPLRTSRACDVSHAVRHI